MLFLQAVCEGNIEFIREYIDSGKDVCVKDPLGNTALHLSISPVISQLLLKSGADPNAQNDKLQTPLHFWPIITGKRDLFIPNDKDLVDMLKILLEAGASPNIQDIYEYSSLHVLFLYGTQLGKPPAILSEVLQMLLDHGAEVNIPDYEGRTPLHHAVKEQTIFVQMLLKAGSMCNVRDKCGTTPLQHLLYSEQCDTINLLLDYEADPSIPDRDGRTILFNAASVGNYRLIEMILRKDKTCINASDQNGVTPLHTAAAYKRADVVELLLAYEADLNAKDIFNSTPLHYASYGGTPEIVSLLIEAGADENARDDSGELPEQHAMVRHFYHTAKRFRTGCFKSALNIPEDASVEAEDEIFLKNSPIDDIFNVILPQSKILNDAFDIGIFPSDFIPYMKAVANDNMESYLKNVHTIPGIGSIPCSKEVKKQKEAVECFITKWVSIIAEIDVRFQGTLLPSGSSYEDAKVEDPCEYDFMIILDRFQHDFHPVILDSSTFNDITVMENTSSSHQYELQDFCVDGELKSGKVLSAFVITARRALSQMRYESGCSQLYVENLTEHTYIDDTFINPNTVTCNIKLQWTGLKDKQLTISVDLVPALFIKEWPSVIALNQSALITDKIKSSGCHLVCKEGKWRLSFSLAEQAIFRSLTQEENKAYTGSKIILFAGASAMITIYDDSDLFSEKKGSQEGSVTSLDDVVNDIEDNIADTLEPPPNVTQIESIPVKNKAHGAEVDDTRVAINQGKEGFTCPKVLTEDNIFDCFIEDDDSSTSSDIKTVTFQPKHMIGTYLLKMTFFHVLEESRSSSREHSVTCKDIFSKLKKFAKEDKMLPYYFVPKHDMLSSIKGVDRMKTELSISLINYIFESIP